FSSDREMARNAELIKYISDNYNIDTDRVIISGGSSGAGGAYGMVAHYGNLFSCAVIGSGITYGMNPEELTNLPIWVLHGKSRGCYLVFLVCKTKSTEAGA
ncbi:MAG: prolyl oligopeptidase family serine peptidase, partial [Desulfovibrio sp.]|nr:prolyl oligopeptidase family serine peptidase [Desulfovibrio sp.]